MIEMTGPDPIRHLLAPGRRSAALKAWRTRRTVAAAREAHRQMMEGHDDRSTMNNEEHS